MKKRLLLVCVIVGLMGFVFQMKAQEGSEDYFPLQGCVKWISETIFKAEINNGVIGKGEIISQNADTLFYNTDGSVVNTRSFPYLANNADSIAYQYDDSGRCIKMVIYYPNHQLRESRTLIYNNQGQLKLCIVRSTDEEVVDAISYTYDPYGKLAIRIYNRKDGDMHQQRFAYDQHGNWIVRVDFNEYDPVYYVEREIEYYPD
ncbi:MAG: hypothetical protein RR837_08025 [Bacteroidales bacterium]